METYNSVKANEIEKLLSKLGLVFFISQSVEYNLVTIISLAQLSGEIDSEKSIRELMNTYYSYTMGRTKNDLVNKLEIEDDLKEQLNKVIVARNWLAHNFYREYGLSAFNQEVRLLAFDKLNKAQELFEKTNELLVEVIYKKGERAGYSKEDIDGINERYQKKCVDEVLPAEKFWEEELSKKGW